MSDSDEEVDVGKSWISMKSLRQAADIKVPFKKQKIRRNSSQLTSPNSSITMEWKPNTYINQSISFSFIHENYCNDDEEY